MTLFKAMSIGLILTSSWIIFTFDLDMVQRNLLECIWRRKKLRLENKVSIKQTKIAFPWSPSPPSRRFMKSTHAILYTDLRKQATFCLAPAYIGLDMEFLHKVADIISFH